MKMLAAVGFSAIALGIFGCSADTSADAEGGNGVSEDELRKLGANGALSCEADSGGARLALVSAGAGKFALVSLKPAGGGDLFALSSSTGTLTTTNAKWSWKNASSSFELGVTNMRGTLKRGAQSTKFTCAAASAPEAGAWRTANGLAGYADEIDGLADTVTEEMADAASRKPYTVFAVATSKRSSLSLGTTERGSAGALPGDDAESLIDENDFSYGGMSAAYSLGGGDDYGEWFQGASDGISLSGDVVPALTNGARAGFIAHSKAKALSSVVDSAEPSAVEITVGPWTFFVPDAFPK